MNDKDKIEVVGFEVEPLSLSAASIQARSASAVEHLYRAESKDFQKLEEGKDIDFSYSLSIIPSDTLFSDRLKPYIQSLESEAISARPIEWF